MSLVGRQSDTRTSPSNQQNPSPGFLMHFPNLKTWSLSASESKLRFVLPSGLLKAELNQNCPLLSHVRLRDSPKSMWMTLFTDVFSNLKEISFDYMPMSVQVLTTILLRQDTVESIQANPGKEFDFERDVFPPGPDMDHFQTSGPEAQLLPRSCTRTGIRGLETKEFMLRATDLWRAGWRKHVLARRGQSNIWLLDGNGNGNAAMKAGTAQPAGVALLDSDYSIEACIARHLLQFEKLKNVWLGYKTWHHY
ncbi:hypothetical protein BGX30_011470 [Mortierella sp. GBA39]|nr:hypothetical protein BGX30_011470 [Mortierella sp. GBA39]